MVGYHQETKLHWRGGPGAGKTLFSFEYLYNNAKAGNNALYFSLEETSDMIIESLNIVGRIGSASHIINLVKGFWMEFFCT